MSHTTHCPGCFGLYDRVTAVERRLDDLERAKDDHLVRRLEAISTQLQDTKDSIMSAISDFAARQTTFNTRIGGAIDGLVGDIANLNAQIQALQNSQGTLSPEDQAILNDLETAGQQLADRIQAVDELTPPVPPTKP